VTDASAPLPKRKPIHRRILDSLYDAATALSAIAIVAICGLMAAPILGRQLGFSVPSANEMADFLVGVVTGFALAPAFRAGSHIRVTLLIGRLPVGMRRIADLLVLVLIAVVTVVLTWRLCVLTLNSYNRGSLSPGLLPIPLWRLQACFTLGFALLTVAVVDTFVEVLRFGSSGATALPDDAPPNADADAPTAAEGRPIGE